ncbi:MAG: hypothetical protein ACJ79J_00180 [Gemmatimonadaceae bacterium]|jgi:hypothetical protein
MKPTPTVCAAIMLAATGASHLGAQCTGTNTCTTTHTVSATVNVIVMLEMSSTTTTLTSPTANDIHNGTAIVDAGPTLTISANESWTLNIRSQNSSNWTFVGALGGQNGRKSIGDLAWSTSAGGTFTPITSNDAVFLADGNPADHVPSPVFFRTTWGSDFSAGANAPGTYSLPIAFTLTAP